MADYSNYPKVRAAFDKLNKLKNRLNGATSGTGLDSALDRVAAKNGENSPEYRKIKAEYEKVKAQVAEAEAAFKAAKKPADDIEAAKNKKKNQEKAAKEKEKSDKSISAIQAQLDSARRRGEMDKVAELQAQIDGQRTEADKNVQLADNPNAVVDVSSANRVIDSMVKSARTDINAMSVPERIDLAKRLTAAGIETKDYKGMVNEDLIANYKILLGQTKAYNTNNKDVPDFKPVDMLGYEAYAKQLIAAGGGTGGGGGAGGISNYISDPTQAAATVNNVISSLFNGRTATKDEVKALSSILIDAQKRNPYKTVNGIRTGGINDEQLLKDVITSGEYGANKKLGKLPILQDLSKQVETNKTNKTELALDQIKKTAQANGYPVNDVMLQKYADRIKAGESIDVLKKDIRSMVAATMPDNVKKLLDAGSDLEDVYAPYKTTMASILEVPYDKISLTDPTLTSAITAQGNMPLYEFKNALRKDTRWQYTDNAKQTVSDGLSQVLRDFGFMG